MPGRNIKMNNIRSHLATQDSTPFSVGFVNKCLLIISSWAAALFIAISLHSHIDIQSLIVKFFNGFYIPHHNFCLPGKIAGWNLLVCVYILILLSAATFVILKMIFRKSSNDFQLAPTIKNLMHAFLILVILFQTMNQARYFIAMYQGYHGKTIEERRSPLLREISLFAQYCQERLPGQHNARFLSDLDLSNDPGMFIHRALAYYLYPIDIRDIRKGDKDSLIIHKANAVQHIPEGYTLIEQINEYNAIAIKSLKDNP